MLASAIPTKMPVVWGSGAAGANIRTVPVTTGDPNAASFTLGWPPNTLTSAGTPPSGLDDNGINNAMTAWLRWMQAGGPIYYDASFQSSIGGYPAGAIIQRADGTGLWRSTTDNNVTDPDTGGLGWVNLITNISGNSGTATNVNIANVAVTLGADWKIDANGQLTNNANSMYLAHVYNSIGTAAGTIINFDTISQQGSNYSIFSTGTVAVAAAGLYEIACAGVVNNSTTATNGTQTINVNSGTLLSHTLTVDYDGNSNVPVTLLGLWQAPAAGRFNITSSITYAGGALTVAAGRCGMTIMRRG